MWFNRAKLFLASKLFTMYDAHTPRDERYFCWVFHICIMTNSLFGHSIKIMWYVDLCAEAENLFFLWKYVFIVGAKSCCVTWKIQLLNITKCHETRPESFKFHSFVVLKQFFAQFPGNLRCQKNCLRHGKSFSLVCHKQFYPNFISIIEWEEFSFITLFSRYKSVT